MKEELKGRESEKKCLLCRLPRVVASIMHHGYAPINRPGTVYFTLSGETDMMELPCHHTPGSRAGTRGFLAGVEAAGFNIPQHSVMPQDDW